MNQRRKEIIESLALAVVTLLSQQQQHQTHRRYLVPSLLLLLLWIAVPFTNSMIIPMTTTTISKRFSSYTSIQSFQRNCCCGRGVILPFMKYDSTTSTSTCTDRHHYQRQKMRLFSSNTDSDNIMQPSSMIVDKKRIVFLGSPPVAAESLQDIYKASQQSDSLYNIVAVISQPPKRAKRGGKIEHTAVSQMAQQLNISTILTPEKANDPTFLQEFCNVVRPDLCITAAYGQYLPKKFLQTPKYGTINIHPSLLPKWRGASPVQRSLEAGDNPLGVTVLYTISKMDAGDRKSTRLNSSHLDLSRMPSSA